MKNYSRAPNSIAKRPARLARHEVVATLSRMSFDLAIFGTLVFTREDFAAWKRLEVDSSRWRSIARVFPESPKYEKATVASILKELPAASRHDLFRVDRDGDFYKVRGRFASSPFRERARQIIALFMTANDVDARGDVYFVGEGVNVGYAVQLPGGKPLLATLDEEEVGRRSRDPEIDQISGYFRVAESVPPPPPPPSSGPISGPGSSGRALLKLPKSA